MRQKKPDKRSPAGGTSEGALVTPAGLDIFSPGGENVVFSRPRLVLPDCPNPQLGSLMALGGHKDECRLPGERAASPRPAPPSSPLPQLRIGSVAPASPLPGRLSPVHRQVLLTRPNSRSAPPHFSSRWRPPSSTRPLAGADNAARAPAHSLALPLHFFCTSSPSPATLSRPHPPRPIRPSSPSPHPPPSARALARSSPSLPVASSSPPFSSRSPW